MPESKRMMKSETPREQPGSQRAQGRRALPKRRQGLERLRVQQAHPLLRRRDADDRRMGGLCPLAVCAGRLAQGRGISEHVQQVVLNLECQADWSRKTAQCLVQTRDRKSVV